jgi:pilus assembly protein Flp/PilA
MRIFLIKLFHEQAGPTAIEYALIAALIAVVTITGLTQLGTALNAKYSTVATDVAAT